MKSWLLLMLVILLLVACDTGEVGRSLAQCMLSPQAKKPNGFGEGIWNGSYLSLCMKAKGYVIDDNLTDVAGTRCRELVYPQIEAGCYRSDNALAKWWYGGSSSRQ